MTKDEIFNLDENAFLEYVANVFLATRVPADSAVGYRLMAMKEKIDREEIICVKRTILYTGRASKVQKLLSHRQVVGRTRRMEVTIEENIEGGYAEKVDRLAKGEKA